ncbi:methyltransferase [Rickettsiella grylli]|uniref:methyltransferase n=1 Tax=Rickettsiella grylli TaxID=59196 RepID=UPI0000DAE598|nr:methyltransferase [Rickettsiella grylli]
MIIKEDDLYSLTPYGKDYLLEDGAYYFGAVFDLLIRQEEVRSTSAIKQALLKGKPQIYAGQALFEKHRSDPTLLEVFTKAMHAKSKGPAQAWVNKFSFSDHKILLDIGGGAGTHAIYACLQSNNLQGIVYDMPSVCQLSQRYIQKYKLDEKISIHPGDMWLDAYPEADLHFYSDILHDWSIERCYFLLEKSFFSLSKNGKIIIHEMLLNEDKTGPQNVVAYNLNMLLWTEGQQFSKGELEIMLTKAGFKNIMTLNTFADWCIMMGEKL